MVVLQQLLSSQGSFSCNTILLPFNKNVTIYCLQYNLPRYSPPQGTMPAEKPVVHILLMGKSHIKLCLCSLPESVPHTAWPSVLGSHGGASTHSGLRQQKSLDCWSSCLFLINLSIFTYNKNKQHKGIIHVRYYFVAFKDNGENGWRGRLW